MVLSTYGMWRQDGACTAFQVFRLMLGAYHSVRMGKRLHMRVMGSFRYKDYGNFLHIQSDVFGGNSGGPLLNKQGVLIGVVARSDCLMNVGVIPMRHILKLLSESGLEHSRTRR